MKLPKTLTVKTDVRAGAVTVYGTDTCSWTTKQKNYLDTHHIPYTYVNCKTQACPGVSAYPTLDVDGQRLVGFQEL